MIVDKLVNVHPTIKTTKPGLIYIVELYLVLALEKGKGAILLPRT